MKYTLRIDKETEEEVFATVHAPSNFTTQLEALVLQYNGTDKLTAYHNDDLCFLAICEIECVTVLNGKTYAIDATGTHYRLKQRLHELEPILPSCFIRINKSALANETKLRCFRATYSGGVDAVFQCGHTDYVSRRCFSQIKRRFTQI